MEKVIYDEKNGLWYELQGDYYIPCLKLPEEEQQPIGVWGQRHLRYIKQHRKVLYFNLLTSGKLNGYLADLDKQAEEMFSRKVEKESDSFALGTGFVCLHKSFRPYESNAGRTALLSLLTLLPFSLTSPSLLTLAALF